VLALAQHQAQQLMQAGKELQEMYSWNWLDPENQIAISDALTALGQAYAQARPGSLSDLDELLNHGQTVEEHLRGLRHRVSTAQPPAPEPDDDQETAGTTTSYAPVRLRRRLTSTADLDGLIARLQQLRSALVAGQAVDLDFED